MRVMIGNGETRGGGDKVSIIGRKGATSVIETMGCVLRPFLILDCWSGCHDEGVLLSSRIEMRWREDGFC